MVGEITERMLHYPRRLEHRIVYDRKQEGAEQAWQMAMAVKDSSLNLPEAFYEQELEQVILAQGVTTRMSTVRCVVQVEVLF